MSSHSQNSKEHSKVGRPLVRSPAKRPKPVFQIGFNRCGTTSLHQFLLASGLRSRHWDEGLLARRIKMRMDAGQDPIMDYPLAVGFTDMIDASGSVLIEPYKRFEYLHQWYPDAYFILNTRMRENWIASRATHVFKDGSLISAYARILNIPEAQVPDYWRAEWQTHHVLVRAYFKGVTNFLEFNIERDDPRKLTKFIGRRYRQCEEIPFCVHNPGQPKHSLTAAERLTSSATGSAEVSHAEVIYDFGMNNGDDVEYYLLKAPKVVAVEANAALCKLASERFASEVASGRLTILNVALAEQDSTEPLDFYVHKTNHVLSQLPEPAKDVREDFKVVQVQRRTPSSVIAQFGRPLYVKIDLEHCDLAILKELFAAEIFPSEISAEAHSVRVFTCLVENGYKRFALVDGNTVHEVYRKALIDLGDRTEQFSFREHSAGPFGSDIASPWEDANAFLDTLAAAGLGWKDIHASGREPERHSLSRFGSDPHTLQPRPDP